MKDSAQSLTALFEAERAMRAAESALLQDDPKALSELLRRAVSEAKAITDTQESRMRLERLSDLCAQVAGPEMTDALVAILDDQWPGVRVQAAEALADVGYERYAEVARGIERALATEQFHALQELPWVLVEIGEPSARKLIARFLEVKNADVVASAIEALAELGDPASIKDIKPFADDTREVEVEGEEGDETVTVGDLATEALEALEALGDGED
jgi:HEAT repeat protein